jgi:hypothetical protein
MGIQQKINSTWSKIHAGDLKDGVMMIVYIDSIYGMTHVFQTLDLAVNEPIQ